MKKLLNFGGNLGEIAKKSLKIKAVFKFPALGFWAIPPKFSPKLKSFFMHSYRGMYFV